MIKAALYIIFFMITIWSMSGLDLNRLFKQSRIIEARIIYLFISMSITYLVVNFFYDFLTNFQIIK